LETVRDAIEPMKRTQLEKIVGKGSSTILNYISYLKERGLLKDSKNVPNAYLLNR